MITLAGLLLLKAVLGLQVESFWASHQPDEFQIELFGTEAGCNAEVHYASIERIKKVTFERHRRVNLPPKRKHEQVVGRYRESLH